jgi:fatty-acyl-CoA synthase
MRSASHNAGGWLARRALLSGRRVAVCDAERTLDYAALEERSARLAGVLRAAGVQRGERVALLLGNRSAYLEAVFAAARLGAIAVPLNIRLAAPEIQRLLADCTPRALLHERALAPLVTHACDKRGAAPVRLEVGGAPDAYEAALASAEPARAIHAVSPDDPMLLLYTSGTTGIPRGALLPHRKTLFNTLNAMLFFELTSRDVVLCAVPLFHSFGLSILSIPALYAGARLVLQPRFEAQAVWEAVARERASVLGAVPTMLRALHESAARAARRPDTASLRVLFSAGSALPVELARAFEPLGLAVQQGYGQTETSILCCLSAEDALRKAGSVGRPVFHAELRLIDPATLALRPEEWRECGPGEPGEIVVRGPITMLGYWNQPKASAEVLREGWLRTGDLATRDAEGFFTLVGRARDLYISGGENVYPAEIEAVFLEHPAIREIAVVGAPDPRWGEVGRAYLVLEPGFALEPEALLAWGAERLASFKLPRSFVALSSLPRTETGKVQKHRLSRAEPAASSPDTQPA